MPDQVRHGIVGCTGCAEVNFHPSWCPDAIGEWGILKISRKRQLLFVQSNLSMPYVEIDLTKKGIDAGEEIWMNPLLTLYPEIGPSHINELK
jgi:hypothetical protein